MIAQRAPIKWIDNLKKKCMGVEIDKKNGFMQ